MARGTTNTTGAQLRLRSTPNFEPLKPLFHTPLRESTAPTSRSSSITKRRRTPFLISTLSPVSFRSCESTFSSTRGYRKICNAPLRSALPRAMKASPVTNAQTSSPRPGWGFALRTPRSSSGHTSYRYTSAAPSAIGSSAGRMLHTVKTRLVFGTSHYKCCSTCLTLVQT